MPPVPSPTGGDGSPVEPMKPASTSPMKRMNRPMPAVIASLSCIGTASKTSLRSPGRRQQHDDEPVDDDEAHRLGPGDRADHRRREEGVDAEARGERERQPRDDAEQDRHDARGERRGGRDLRELEPVSRRRRRRSTG